ncbi:sigma-70 family RNA polymerase sigma factor [Actinoplanes sp. LDG1-06]|uniref:Sigma-70 family RNA polymerase sigma factor n=1 Tax=Paractinoplanes ovalisporus TaxID=2810368 RepID=A0ABS2AA30_9ACTN|nr:sigma-70 family RNA polymerase sigma factor [Actinoplanes ovalisporus]MBM2616116.1 sigma-70 family RNA polymerase sigma factor [Actinoplanes ovalisporus]
MSGPDRIDDLLRALAPQVVGVLTHRFGDFEAAEDAVQEALLAAATHWPVDGTPENPRGWLIQTATRKMLDQLRGEQARRRREITAALREPAGAAYDRDDTLDVLLMCCHPALGDAAAVALTLRAVGGLTTAEIARAFLVPEPTMGQRISRAKQRIRGVPFDSSATRLTAALRVLYLIFNEGYASSGDAVHRVELSAEAIRLTRMVWQRRPEDGEVAGLLALMLLTDARRPARTGTGGQLVPLAEQDRSRWDADLIKEGTAILDAAFRRGQVGEYQLQAAIAALHDRAPSVTATDWPQIVALYGLLERMTASPVVALNRAIAVAMVDGPAAGLDLVAALEARLDGHHRVAATRAHLLELAGDDVGAAAAYRVAAAATTSEPEKRYLTLRAARLNARTAGP